MEDWRLEQWSFCADCPARIDTGVLTADLGVGFICRESRDSSVDMATNTDTAMIAKTERYSYSYNQNRQLLRRRIQIERAG